jgi:hypothetical protein
MLRRTLVAAGLTEDCVEPRSILKWRGEHTLNTKGFPSAMHLLGKTTALQVHNFIYEGRAHVDADHATSDESDLDSFFD